MGDAHEVSVGSAQEKFDAAKERCLVSGASLRDAESRHREVDNRCTEAKEVAKQSAEELKKAQKDLAVAQQELAAFSQGPLEAFLALHGSPAVERPREREAKRLKLCHTVSST